MTKIFSFLVLILCTSISTLRAQQVEVKGEFLKDSVHIGDELPYSLTARYPTSLTVLFPDSTYSFAPFEYSKKKIFTTVSANGKSLDSVVYYLATFEVDSIQRLALPVFLVTRKDSTAYRAAVDSIRLIELVTTPPPDTVQAQNLALKTNTAYEHVLHLFNYPILVIALVALLVLAIIGWVIFGKRIKRYFRVKRMSRQFNEFKQSFEDKVSAISLKFTPELTEEALSLWKKYLEKLEKKPFTKLTTRETLLMEQDEQLGQSLRALDRAIYGHEQSVVDSLNTLKQIAESRFTLKLEEVKHG